jgi:hypothetical protein
MTFFRTSCAGSLGAAVAGLLALSGSAAAGTAQPSARVLAAPSPVERTDHRRHLVYEIVVDNPAATPASVERLVVLDQRRRRLAAYDAAAIAGLALPYESVLAPGARAVLRLDVALPTRRRPPSALAHRLVFSIGNERVRTLAAPTPVARTPALRVAPPLRHPRVWAAMTHAPVMIDGRLSHSQRYAFDFVGLHPGGEVFVGDPARNESYALYGAGVHAAAAGTIVAVRDGMPDNTAATEPPFGGWEDVAGNRVVQDLGDGRYALYAHLQPGSVAVAAGDRVQAGQPLGRVGNTGLSSGPHLHFQMMDGPGGPSALDADGLPYVFDRFELAGNLPDPFAPVLTPAAPPLERTDQLPLSGDVVGFGSEW